MAPVVVAQSSSDSLGDIARESRAHAGNTKRVYDNQNSDFGRSADDSQTPCGAPIAGLPAGYVTSMLGQTIADDQLAKALLKWLEKHPDADLLHPADLARINFPDTAAQEKDNQQAAREESNQWLRQASAPQDDSASGATAPAPSGSTIASLNSALAKAVDAEQQRRIRSDGSAADRLQEASNLYSICESRRQLQFQPEVDRLAKEYLQKQLASNADAANHSSNDSVKGE